MDGSKSHEVANVAASAGEKRKRESESKVSTSVRKGKVFIGENDRGRGEMHSQAPAAGRGAVEVAAH